MTEETKIEEQPKVEEPVKEEPKVEVTPFDSIKLNAHN